MMMLKIEEIILLHQKLIDRTGGMDGVRDLGLLESAVNGVHAAFGDVEAYPSIEEKAARLAYAIINNHAFVDGNKRIGILVMLVTLKLNGVPICYNQQELIDLGLSLASDKIGYEATLQWIRQHKL